MKDFAEQLVKKFNEYARKFGFENDIFEIYERSNGAYEFFVFPYELIMNDEEDEVGQIYNGPEIMAYVRIENDNSIHSVASCMLNLEEDQRQLVIEYDDRLSKLDNGEGYGISEDEDGMTLDCTMNVGSKDKGWEYQLLASMDDEEAMEEIFYMLFWAPCRKLMNYIIDIDAILSDELTIDEAIEIITEDTEE